MAGAGLAGSVTSNSLSKMAISKRRMGRLHYGLLAGQVKQNPLVQKSASKVMWGVAVGREEATVWGGSLQAGVWL